MSQPTSKLSRRTLFAGASTVGAVAATASLMPSISGVASNTEPVLKVAPEKGGGYSLSEHVKRYYKTARV